jgi:PEP-CTERM/exosortase A-associated glycosyltransferase
MEVSSAQPAPAGHGQRAATFKVLHLLDHSLPEHSGYAFRTASILHEQQRLGWDTWQVTSAKQAPDAGDHLADGLRFHRTTPGGSWVSRLPVINQLDVVRGLAARAGELVRDFAPDVLHAHSPCLIGLAGLWVSKRFGIPLVYEMRSSWEDAAVSTGTTQMNSLRYRASMSLETFVLRNADAVTTICEGLRSDIVARGIPSARVTVIPNAVDDEMLETDEAGGQGIRQQIANGGTILVGFMGSFYRWEGLDTLIAAAADLARDEPDVRIVIAGGGAEEGALREQVTATGLRKTVTFLGRVPHAQVRQYYAAMDMLVYPRTSSPLTEKVTPLKPLEAMAQGKLVLASDVGGHRELISHGVTGLVFPPGDPKALAQAIRSAIRRPDADAIRRNAGQFVRQSRTWSRSVAGYAPVYEALGRRRRLS